MTKILYNKDIFLTIVIPTLNEEKVLPEILNCLKNQKDILFDTIISDANSTDNTRKIAETFEIKVIDGGIPSVGRNNALKDINTDLILFLDADISFNEAFIASCIEEFYAKKLDIAGAYFSINKGSLSFIANNLGNNISKFIRQFTKKPIISGDFILIKKDVFIKLNGFEEKMTIGEDNDLVVRAVGSGYKYKVLNKAYNTSSRRIDSVGIIRLTIAFLIFAFGTLIRKEKSKFIQDLLKKTYGEIGKIK